MVDLLLHPDIHQFATIYKLRYEHNFYENYFIFFNDLST